MSERDRDWYGDVGDAMDPAPADDWWHHRADAMRRAAGRVSTYAR